MPPRVARSAVSVQAPKNAKNKSRKRNLDAYSIAGHSIKPAKVASHRLGESLDDNPRQKRRRDDDEDDEEGASEDDSAPRRKLPKSNGRGIAEEGADGVEEGSDSEGNEWRLGGLRDDDEDSDLDSDEAFGESDEEKFDGFTFRGSASQQKPAKKQKRQAVEKDDGDAGIDLDEAEDEAEDEEEEDDFGDEGVDLATMLDVENEDMEDDDVSDDDDSDGDGDDESASEAESEDDHQDEEERIARLRDRVEAMDAVSRPNAAPTALDEDGALTLDDLLGDDPTARREFAAPLKMKRKSQAPKTLNVPLPKRHQDRLDRQLASQKAKEQLDRWKDTIIHNRRAEFLTFPLVDPNAQNPVGKEKFVTDGAPQGELEENIRKIMEDSGMVAQPGEKPEDAEEEIMKAEELGTHHLPIEEVMRRRAELRRTRALLFSEEIKAKRIAKIKSKSYRRVHRKERERMAEKERALLDPEGRGLPMDEDEQERTDRKRAEERMSTKHRDSKFAKTLKATNRTVWDEGARDGVHEQARRKEDLRRRIAGEEVAASDGSDVPSDGDDEDEGIAGEDADTRTLRQLNQLRDQGAGIGQKGVGGMKFMRDAEERKRARNNEDIERMRKDMAVADGDEDESGEEVDDQGLGRAIFGPTGKERRDEVKKVKRPELEEGDMSDDKGADLAVDEHRVVSPVEAKAKPKSILKKPAERASGPLVQGGARRDRRDPNAAQSAVAEQELASASSWLTGGEPSKAKKGRIHAAESDGSDMLGSVDVPAALPIKAGKTKAKAVKTVNAVDGHDTPSTNGTAAGSTDGWQTVPYTNGATVEEHASDEEAEADPILSAHDAKTSYHRRAFAGDEVETAFAADKAADIASEDEKEVSTHVPGWGSWTGTGLSKSLKKANKRAAHNPLYKTKLPGGVKAADRKDAKMANVIVSEKAERKGKKYLAPVLPHEFERGEQYERSLRVPVGPEWTTKEVFQRGTRPRVLVRPGVVVGAMERPVV